MRRPHNRQRKRRRRRRYRPQSVTRVRARAHSHKVRQRHPPHRRWSSPRLEARARHSQCWEGVAARPRRVQLKRQVKMVSAPKARTGYRLLSLSRRRNRASARRRSPSSSPLGPRLEAREAYRKSRERRKHQRKRRRQCQAKTVLQILPSRLKLPKPRRRGAATKGVQRVRKRQSRQRLTRRV